MKTGRKKARGRRMQLGRIEKVCLFMSASIFSLKIPSSSFMTKKKKKRYMVGELRAKCHKWGNWN